MFEKEPSPWGDVPGSPPEKKNEMSEDISVGDEIGQLVREGRFCEAAKIYGQWSGANPIDSKLAIDRLAHKHDLAPHSGCLSYLMLLLFGLGYALFESVRLGGQWLG